MKGKILLIIFLIFELTSAGEIKLVGSCSTPSFAHRVVVAGNYVYVAMEGSELLQVIDIGNPSRPIRAGSIDTPGAAYGIAVAGDHAFLADYGKGLQIINISNPVSPTGVGNCDTPGSAQGISVLGEHAYVADMSGGLQIINISAPTSPIKVGSYHTSGRAIGVCAVGNSAYVPNKVSGLQVVNISNPAVPTGAGSFATPGLAVRVAVVGNYAYVADGDTGLQILDVSNCVHLTEYYRELKAVENRSDEYKGSISFTDGYGRPSKQIDVAVFSKNGKISHVLLKMNNLSNSDYANFIAYAPMIEFKKYPNDQIHIAYCLPEELKTRELVDLQIVRPGESEKYLFHFNHDYGIPESCGHYSMPHSIAEILSDKARLVIQVNGTMFEIDNLHK